VQSKKLCRAVKSEDRFLHRPKVRRRRGAGGQVEYEGVGSDGLGLGRRPPSPDDVDDENVAEKS